MKIVEINTKAKPYNPAEEVVGLDLIWTFAECQLVGDHYYSSTPVPVEKGKMVLALSKEGFFSKTQKALGLAGWVMEKASPYAQWLPFSKRRVVSPTVMATDTLLLCSEWHFYKDWLVAAEVCKYLKLRYLEDKQVVEGIHKLVVDGWVIDKEGKLASPKAKTPAVAGWADPEAHWHPPGLQAVAQAQAAHAGAQNAIQGWLNAQQAEMNNIAAVPAGAAVWGNGVAAVGDPADEPPLDNNF